MTCEERVNACQKESVSANLGYGEPHVCDLRKNFCVNLTLVQCAREGTSDKGATVEPSVVANLEGTS